MGPWTTAVEADTLVAVARDRASYGIDGGYIGIPYFLAVETGLVTAGRWAKRRDKPIVAALTKAG
ncbi:MAG TPA: hypothetical protein VK425_10995, partial [Acidimicrobiales bacterium]|nr:hypothetical protein [Acidimicrobiales bacterium]